MGRVLDADTGMTCARCHGLMIERPCWERNWRQVSSRWTQWPYMWACMNCGERLDSIIAFNRRHGPAMMSMRHAVHWKTIRALVAAQRQEVT